jgi:hypothetical protein
MFPTFYPGLYEEVPRSLILQGPTRWFCIVLYKFVINIGPHITGLICTTLHVIIRIFVMMDWWRSLRPKHVAICLNKRTKFCLTEIQQFVVNHDLCYCIPISRPTDATCDRFLFSIYMCITLHVSSIKRSSSGVLYRTYSLQFLCLCRCLSASLSCKKLFLQDSAADRQKLEAVCTVRDSWWCALDARNM